MSLENFKTNKNEGLEKINITKLHITFKSPQDFSGQETDGFSVSVPSNELAEKIRFYENEWSPDNNVASVEVGDNQDVKIICKQSDYKKGGEYQTLIKDGEVYVVEQI